MVNGVVHVELYKKLPQLNEMENKSLNDWLIEKGYAELAEESYLSKVLKHYEILYFLFCNKIKQTTHYY